MEKPSASVALLGLVLAGCAPHRPTPSSLTLTPEIVVPESSEAPPVLVDSHLDEVSRLELEMGEKLLGIESVMPQVFANLEARKAYLSPGAYERIQVLKFFFENNFQNPNRNAHGLQRAREAGEPIVITDDRFFFYRLGDLPPGVNAQYNLETRVIFLLPSFEPTHSLSILNYLHELDHALSWFLRLHRPVPIPGMTPNPFDYYRGKELINEEAGRYALQIEMIDAFWDGELKARFTGERAKNSIDSSDLERMSNVLGLTSESPANRIFLELARDLYGGGGSFHYYPPAFMKSIYRIYEKQTIERGDPFSPVVEAPDGQLVPYTVE